MKGSVRILRIINYLWLFIIVLILIFAVIPIIPGIVVVKPPGPDGWTTTITDDTVIVTGNVSVRNGGFFAFNNFYFVVKLYNENGTDLAIFSSTRTNLLPGLWMDVPVTFFLNKTALGSDVLEALLRSEVTFASLIYFNINYLFDFRIQAGFRGNITVGPLIRDLNVDWNNTIVKTNGTDYEMDIPYSFNSRAVMNGSQLSITGSISNATSLLGSISTNATLGGPVNSTIVIRLSQDAYDHLSTSPDHLFLDLQLKLNDAIYNVTSERDWVPPSQGGG
jgi:hypothetical protein